MFKHKVIDLLKSLTPDEINRFKKFLNVYFFKKNVKLTLFFTELIKFYPDFDNEKLSKEYLYFKTTGKEKYNDSTIRNLCFDLQTLIFEFLYQQQLETRNFTSKNFLLQELINRRQFSLTKRLIRKMDNDLNKNGDVDFDYLYERFVFESFKYNYFRESGKVLNKEQSLSQIKQMSFAGNYLSLMFITELISEYINIRILSDKYNISIENNIVSNLLDSIDLNRFFFQLRGDTRISFIIDIYYALYSLYKEMNKVKYCEYENLVRENFDKLSFDEKSFHYSRLISFCIIQNNKKPTDYFSNELFRLYEFFLINELYINKKTKYIPLSLFRAILQLALNLKKSDWAENFIINYHKKVPEKYKLNMFHYGFALLYSVTGNYKSSLDSISKIDFDNFIFKYDLYTLKFKILYDFGDTAEVLGLIKSYKEFLRRDQLLTEVKKVPHKNFIKYLLYLINCKDKFKNYDSEQIKSKLLGLQQVTSKDWLLEKFDEINQDNRKIKNV